MPKLMDIERLRNDFRPAEIKLLIVGESPPNDTSRFFYNDEVKKHDSLYLETMKAIHLRESDVQGSRTREFRENKDAFLNDFVRRCFYLIDVVPNRIEKKVGKKSEIEKNTPIFLEKLGKLEGFNKDKTRIVLMSRFVFKGLLNTLKERGYNVCDEMLPFGGNGQQPRFRRLLRKEIKNISDSG